MRHRTQPARTRGSITRGARQSMRLATAALAAACTALVALAALPQLATAEECPNATFRVGPAAHLPDCRAYEMVSPPYKATGFPVVMSIGPSGSSLLLDISGAVSGAEGFPDIINFDGGAIYTTRRTSSGWSAVPDELPMSEYLPFLENGFSSWQGAGGEGPGGPLTVWTERGPGEAENRIDFFARELDGSVVDIGPALPPSAPPAPPLTLGDGIAGLHAQGLTADGSHYFFVLEKERWPLDDTQVGFPSLYEYVGAGNTEPLPVGVNNEGRQLGLCGEVLGGTVGGVDSQSSQNAVSRDGRTVFFSVNPPGMNCTASAPPVREVFARIDNGSPGARTVAVSEPSEADCAACYANGKMISAGRLANALFACASADGSKVFFTTTQPLLGQDGSTNLYEYDFGAPAGERLIRVSAGDATIANPTAEVLEFAGRSPQCSQDGSHVYFIAGGVLTKNANGEGEAAAAGANNLYVFERDARFPAGHIAFVARLSDSDVSQSEPNETKWNPGVTPDGRFLVFASDRDLTPDDTSTARQIFEYNAQGGSLVRVSIGEDGFNNNGNVKARFVRGTPRAGEELNGASIKSTSYEHGFTGFGYWLRLSVSADGAYVFFQSSVGLTPQALNQKVIGLTEEGSPIYANNVYEYHDGRVSLVSDGQDITFLYRQSNVELIGTDESGQDVFFATTDQLVGQDTDDNLDVYDARVDGGFPAPVVPASCEGEACQGELGAAPTLLASGSEFQAGGNPPLADESSAKPATKAKKPKRKARGRSGRPGASKHTARARRVGASGRRGR